MHKHTWYVTKDFDYTTVSETNDATISSKVESLQWIADCRTYYAVDVGYPILNKEALGKFATKELYFNYITLLSILAKSKPSNAPWGQLRMGFIPLICEPTGLSTIYFKRNINKIQDSKLPVYLQKPSTFCGDSVQNHSGQDIWVHKEDCKNILNISKGVHLITVKDVWEALNLC